MTGPDSLIMTTIRSHGQYNTTVYNLDDRYRGVFGRRDVVFMNRDDMLARGLGHGDPVDVMGIDHDPAAPKRVVSGFIAIEYSIPSGSVAGYYPEMNRIIALSDFDEKSGTPAYKGAPVTVRKAVFS